MVEIWNQGQKIRILVEASCLMLSYHVLKDLRLHSKFQVSQLSPNRMKSGWIVRTSPTKTWVRWFKVAAIHSSECMGSDFINSSKPTPKWNRSHSRTQQKIDASGGHLCQNPSFFDVLLQFLGPGPDDQKSVPLIKILEDLCFRSAAQQTWSQTFTWLGHGTYTRTAKGKVLEIIYGSLPWTQQIQTPFASSIQESFEKAKWTYCSTNSSPCDLVLVEVGFLWVSSYLSLICRLETLARLYCTYYHRLIDIFLLIPTKKSFTPILHAISPAPKGAPG